MEYNYTPQPTMTRDPNMVTILAFGRAFPIPRANLTESETLSIGLSGRFAEQDEIDLDIEDQYYPAFLIIYDYLLNPNQALPKMSPDILEQVLFLADYLTMPNLTTYLIDTLISGGYSTAEILPILVNFSHLPNAAQAAENIFARRGYFWEKLSNRTRAILEPHFNQDLTKQFTTPIALIPIAPTLDTRKLLSMMPSGWARVCQKGNRPEVIDDIRDIPYLIGQGKKIAIVNDEQDRPHYITCPGGKQLVFKDIGGRSLPCCGTNSTLPTLDPRWANLKAVMTSDGWVALIDPNHKGDFVLIWNPIVVKDLRIVVDASLL